MWNSSSCHVPVLEEEQGGPARVAASLSTPLVEGREANPETNSPSQPVCVSRFWANNSPGTLSPAHPNPSLHKQPQFSTLSCIFPYLSAAVFPLFMRKYFVNCKIPFQY